MNMIMRLLAAFQAMMPCGVNEYHYGWASSGNYNYLRIRTKKRGKFKAWLHRA